MEAPILCIIQSLFIKSAMYINNQKKDNFSKSMDYSSESPAM